MACAPYDAHMEDKWRARRCVIHNALAVPAAARVDSGGRLRMEGTCWCFSTGQRGGWQEKPRSTPCKGEPALRISAAPGCELEIVFLPASQFE